MKNVYRILQPGGSLVFIVPHPLLQNDHKSEKENCNVQSYFARRDMKMEVSLCNNRQQSEHVKFSLKFKAIQDYVISLKEHGFQIIDVRETLGQSQNYVETLNDMPLALIFKARKPVEIKHRSIVTAPKSLDLLPKMLYWSGGVRKNFEASMTVQIPPEVTCEIIAASWKCCTLGIYLDEIEFGKHISEDDFKNTKEFGNHLRKRLLHGIGTVVLQGLDLNCFAIQDKNSNISTEKQMEYCAKLAYYFICRHIGKFTCYDDRGKVFFNIAVADDDFSFLI